jgi:Protein kinase domain
MGVVYLATDPVLRLVAVKALRHGVTGETSRRRLTREFETMRLIHSPFVAEVLDADVDHEPPYIVTRYVPGRTVEDVVGQDGPMTGPALMRLARGLACALTAVHGAGIVHRDLKPANVMLVSGEPVVIDFGIAQALDSTRLTQSGMLMGTPGYLAPEVIEGSASGPAADVHSWAATVAFAATGRPPFGSGSYEAIFYRIVNGQADLATMPATLLPVVLHALARDPSRRPSAAELTERIAALDPAALVPDLAPTIPPGMARADPRTQTYADPRQAQGGGWGAGRAGAGAVGAGAGGLAGGELGAAGLGAGAAGMGAAGLGAGAGGLGAGAGGLAASRPAAGVAVGGARAYPDNFADLLPPVQYQPQPAFARPAGVALPPGAQPWPGPPGAGPLGPGPSGQGQPWPGPAGSGPPGTAAAGRPAAQARSARTPLVLAVMATAIAVSILLPIAGTAAALALLIGLRSADLTSSWLTRRRSRASRPVGMAAAIAYVPVAVLRSLLNLIVKLPLALVFAATAAAVSLLAVSDGTRAGGVAAGALVACYGLGPGSARCRRPLSKFFGAVTGSGPSAVVAFIGMTALAVGTVAAAISVPPYVWPALHLTEYVQHLPLVRTLTGLPSDFTRWRIRLGPVTKWLG